MRSVVIYPEPGYEGDRFTAPAPNNWHVGNIELLRALKEAEWSTKVWPCEVDVGSDIGLAFDHPTYDCKIPDTAMCVNLEPPIIRPRFFTRLHGWPYKRILTCCRPFVDGKKVFWSAFPVFKYDGYLAKERTGQLCAISGGGKTFTLPGEMYTTRRNVYKAFGKLLDLYGWGWEKDQEIMDTCNYMGRVENKVYTLSMYDMAIVIENQVIPGFTSEKYWDCKQAGPEMLYVGSKPDYPIEEAFPAAWTARIVEHLNAL